jgi:hypothetical protein
MSKEKRRSPRLAMRVLLKAEWKVRKGTITRDAITESISAHGALLRLMDECPPVDRVVLWNVASHQEQQARVVGVEPVGGKTGEYLVRVDFEADAPQFWGRVYSPTRQGLKTLHIAEARLSDPVEGCAPRRFGRRF